MGLRQGSVMAVSYLPSFVNLRVWCFERLPQFTWLIQEIILSVRSVFEPSSVISLNLDKSRLFNIEKRKILKQPVM